MTDDDEYCVEWLRPDGWWEAGRGWYDPEQAARDAADQLPKCSWRVVRAAKRPRRAFSGTPRGGVIAASTPEDETEPIKDDKAKTKPPRTLEQLAAEGSVSLPTRRGPLPEPLKIDGADPYALSRALDEVRGEH